MKGSCISIHSIVPYCMERFTIFKEDERIFTSSGFEIFELKDIYVLYSIEDDLKVGETVYVKRDKSFWKAKVNSVAGKRVKVKWFGDYVNVKKTYMPRMRNVFRVKKV